MARADPVSPVKPVIPVKVAIPVSSRRRGRRLGMDLRLGTASSRRPSRRTVVSRDNLGQDNLGRDRQIGRAHV